MSGTQEPISEVEQDVNRPPATPEAKPTESQSNGVKTFSEDYVKTLRQEAAQYRTELRAIKEQFEAEAKKKSDEEAKTLAEQGKWKEIAEKSMSQLKEAEAWKINAERYQETLQKYLDAERQGVPDNLIQLLDKLDPVEQLEWLAANKQTITPPPETQQATQPPKQKLAEFGPEAHPQKAETDPQRVKRLYGNIGSRTSPIG